MSIGFVLIECLRKRLIKGNTGDTRKLIPDIKTTRMITQRQLHRPSYSYPHPSQCSCILSLLPEKLRLRVNSFRMSYSIQLWYCVPVPGEVYLMTVKENGPRFAFQFSLPLYRPFRLCMLLYFLYGTRWYMDTVVGRNYYHNYPILVTDSFRLLRK